MIKNGFGSDWTGMGTPFPSALATIILFSYSGASIVSLDPSDETSDPISRLVRSKLSVESPHPKIFSKVSFT
jgi:hypothetical protein